LFGAKKKNTLGNLTLKKKPAEDSKPEEVKEEVPVEEPKEPAVKLTSGLNMKTTKPKGLLSLGALKPKKKEEPASPKKPADEEKSKEAEKEIEARSPEESSPEDAESSPEPSPSPRSLAGEEDEVEEVQKVETKPKPISSADTTPRLTYSTEMLRQMQWLPQCKNLPESHDLPPGILRGAQSKAMADDTDWRANPDRFKKRDSTRKDDGKKPGARADDKFAKARQDRPIKRREEVVLQTSDTSWSAEQKKLKEQMAADLDAGESEAAKKANDEAVLRSINSILNKLTV